MKRGLDLLSRTLTLTRFMLTACALLTPCALLIDDDVGARSSRRVTETKTTSSRS